VYDSNAIGSTVTSRVTEQLRKDIYSKNIEAGTHISIQEIADKYGISKTPVREAFRTLEGEKLLKFNAHRGAEVIGIDKTYVCEIYEIIQIMESYLTERAFPYIDEMTLNALRETNTMIREVRDGQRPKEQLTELNRRFHQLIMSKANNTAAADLYENYSKQIRTLRKSYMPTSMRIQSIVAEHDAIISAFEKKDPSTLKDAVGTHSSNAMANFFEQYEEDV